jgi:hypothetical protein
MQAERTNIEVQTKSGGVLECRKLLKSVLLKLPAAAPRGLSEEHYNQAAAVLMFRWCVVGTKGLEGPDGGEFRLTKTKDATLGLIASEGLIDVIDLEHDIAAVIEACLPSELSEAEQGN